MPGLVDRYRPQAEAAALLRYNPQRQGLRELLLEAESQRDAGVRAAHATGRGMRQTLRAAREPLSAVYGDAQSRLASNQGAFSEAVGTPGSGTVNQNLAGLGPAAGSIVSAALAEQAASRDRVTEAGSQALSGLEDQRVQSRAGEAFAVRAARDQYGSDAAKLLRQLKELGGEEGVFTAAELARLVDAARGRRVTRRGQDITDANSDASRSETERHNREMEKSGGSGGKGGGGGKNGGPSLTTGQENDAIDAITSARAWVKKLEAMGLQPADIREALTTGAKLRSSSGAEIDVEKIADTYVSAGFDLHRGKRLSRGTARALHRRGIHIPKSWRPAAIRPQTGTPAA